MDEITYDKVKDDASAKVKQLYWDIAFGLQDVDGLKPSRHMISLSKEHINGKKTYEQVKNEITSYYQNNHSDGNEEEADNLFRIAQTESKLKKDKISDEAGANITHYTVGNTVRETIKSLGGTLPENLPTPDKSIKEVQKEVLKEIE